MNIGNLPPTLDSELIYALGIEGSANKIGVGVVRYMKKGSASSNETKKVKHQAMADGLLKPVTGNKETGVGLGSNSGGVNEDGLGEYDIISNPRKTYISPAGQGFLPKGEYTSSIL